MKIIRKLFLLPGALILGLVGAGFVFYYSYKTGKDWIDAEDFPGWLIVLADHTDVLAFTGWLIIIYFSLF